MHDGESVMQRYLFHYFYPNSGVELLLHEVDGTEYQEKFSEFVERSGRSPFVTNRKQREPLPVYSLQCLDFFKPMNWNGIVSDYTGTPNSDF